MRFLYTLFFGFVLGAATTYSAFSYHLVRADEGLVLVPRQRASLSDAYADIRNWQANDWTQHLELAHALVEDGRGDLIRPLNPGQLLNDFLQDASTAKRLSPNTQRH